MLFADPHVCPDCRGAIDGEPRCPHCGLDLTSPQVRQLWQVLLQADALLRDAARTRDAARAAVQQEPQPVAPPQAQPAPPHAQPVPPQPVPPAAPPTQALPLGPWTPQPYPSAAPPAKPRRHVSAGAVLLGLGALGMAVAAFIFLTVSWGSLGVAGRALVLLAFTAIIGGAATWATRRPLRGSAEALWTVFLAMASLDWFVACDQGLLGLDRLSGRGSTIVWAVAAAVVGTLIVSRGRAPLGLDLVAPMVVAGSAVVVGSSVVAVELEAGGFRLFWATVVAAALAAGATAVLHRLRQRVSMIISGVFALAAVAVCATLAVIEVVQNPSADELALQGHGVPMLVVVAGVVAVGVLVAPATTAASGVAALATVFLVAVPAEDAAGGRGALVVLSAAAVLGAVILSGAGAWHRGGRFAVALLTAGLGLTALVWAVDAAEAAAEGLESLRSTPIDAGPADVAGPWWLALVVTAALTAVVLAARRWPEAAPLRQHLLPSACVVAAAGVVVTVAAAEPTYVVTAAVLLAVSGALAVVLDRLRTPWQVVPALGIGLALGASLTHEVASAMLWAIGAVMLAVLSTRVADRWTRDALVLVSAATAVGAVSFTLDASGVDAAGLSLGWILTAGVLAAVALSLPWRRGVPVEIVAGMTAVAGLLVALDQPESIVRAGIFVLAALLVIGLSLLAAREADAWGEIDRPQTYRATGVVTTVAAMLVGLPDDRVALAVWSGAVLLFAVLSWRVAHPVERRVVTFLSAAAAVGALGLGLDLAEAWPETFALAFVGAAALLVLLAGALPGGRERPVELAAGLTLVLGLAWTVDVQEPVWSAVVWTAGGLLLLGASLLRYTWSWADRSLVLRLAGAAVLVVGLCLPLPSSGDSLGFWIGGAMVLALVSWRSPVRLEQHGLALLAAGATAGVAVLALDLADASFELMSLVLVVTAAVLCLVGAVENGARRLPVEVAAAPTALLGVGVATSNTPVSWVALVFTVLGALAVLLGLLGTGSSPYRRLAYRVIGSGSLALAYVLRLVASDVDVVEAYTLPFGVVLLAAGAWTMRAERSTSSLLALGPGLTLVLLPSLPQALADPTGPRALLLGLAALVALVVGVARNLKAPFVLGGLIFALLVIVNVGPYTFALPRWVLIAGASALLLGAGITWEDRVRDGRAAARFVARMR